MQIHVVTPGQTAEGIAEYYGISVQRLISDNGLSATGHLAVGQALIILRPTQTHRVTGGETLYSIAEQYGLTVVELLQNNPTLAQHPYLFEGEVLAIAFEGERIGQAVFNGYAYPFIHREVLLRALPFMTTLTIFGYGFTEKGDLIVANDSELIRRAKELQAQPIMLLSSITENGNFSSARAARLFADPGLQEKILTAILQVMVDKGYVGLDIDFEFIERESKEGFLDFLRRAATMLHEQNFFLHVDLAPKTSATQSGLLYESHDYKQVGEIADSVLLMTYEWGYTYGPPMAVAPLNQVKRVLDYGVSEIATEKILMGIPNYGYDWQLPYERGVTEARVIGNVEAVHMAIAYGSEIRFDELAESPYFYYMDGEGRKHEVWFEDVRSIQAKLRLIADYGLRGAGYWNLMRPFPGNYAMINALYHIEKWT